MKVIGSEMRCSLTSETGKQINNRTLFESVLKKIGLSGLTKGAQKENEIFNDIVQTFPFHIECIKLYLFPKGYKVIKTFKKDSTFKQYVKENRIKASIKRGEILVGNVFGESDVVKCVGIVLATKKDIVNDKVEKILDGQNLN